LDHRDSENVSYKTHSNLGEKFRSEWRPRHSFLHGPDYDYIRPRFFGCGHITQGRRSAGLRDRAPTPESVRRAEVDSRAGLDAILTRAKALDAEGKTAECMELVGTAKLKLE
jgi:hypothetical protein